MRIAAIGLILLLPVASGAALAQGAPSDQNAPPTAAAPQGAAMPPPLPRGNISRDQYVQHAEQRAGAVFDEMDANHDGVLTPKEKRAWRAQHPRTAQQPSH